MLARYGPLFIVAGAHVMAVLPSAIRARERKCLRGKNHSYRERDTH